MSIFQDLAKARAEVERLEKAAAQALSQKLAALPQEYGFSDLNSFIKALKAAAKGGSAVKKKGKPSPKPKAGKRGRRARITPETKEKVRELVAQNKTGAEISSILGISLPSVQNIKKELGLVRTKSKK